MGEEERDVRVPELVHGVGEALVSEGVELVREDVERQLAARAVELAQGTDLLHVLQHAQADVPRELLVVVRRQEEPDDAGAVDLVLEHNVGVVGVDRRDVVAGDGGEEAGEGLADLPAELAELRLDAAPRLPVRALRERERQDVAAGDRGRDVEHGEAHERLRRHGRERRRFGTEIRNPAWWKQPGDHYALATEVLPSAAWRGRETELGAFNDWNQAVNARWCAR